MDQLSEAFMCKKEFSVYFIFTLSLKFLLFLSYDALRICFLTHLVHCYSEDPQRNLFTMDKMIAYEKATSSKPLAALFVRKKSTSESTKIMFVSLYTNLSPFI
jgi:hypothetical protein